MRETYPHLTPEQRTALEAYAEANGKGWREALGIAWMNCAEPEAYKASLRNVRNTFGPTWLHDVYAWGWLPECPAWRTLEGEGEAPRWSAAFPPPEVGARVRISVNGIGAGEVTGYFVQDGYLGLTVLVDSPPERFVKQWGGNFPINTFGAEVELEG